MEHVLIDPGMFLSPEEGELDERIQFFMDIIELCKQSVIGVCLYDEIISKIKEADQKPFPIDINKIHDEEQRNKLKSLNRSFQNEIMRCHDHIDIDSCQGPQDFNISLKGLKEDNEYFTFFSMLLSSCYTPLEFSQNILCDGSSDLIQLGDNVLLSCGCQGESFAATYIWTLPNVFLTPAIRAVKSLREIIAHYNDPHDLYEDSPDTKMDRHHNMVQNKAFSKFDDLTHKNKRVLSELRELGSSSIHFTEFHPQNGDTGCIQITNVDQSSNGDKDIVSGEFFSELEYRIHIILQFPKGIGSCLELYAKNSNGCLTVKSVKHLLTTLGL